MASAKDILNERLAKGEITEDEYERLAQKIDAANPSESVASPPRAPDQVGQQAQQFELSKSGAGGWVVTPLILAAALAVTMPDKLTDKGVWFFGVAFVVLGISFVFGLAKMFAGK